MTNSSIRDCTGYAIRDAGSAILTNSTIIHCSSGGIDSRYVNLLNSSIINCGTMGTGNGGAIGGPVGVNEAVISASTISNCSAQNGGAIYFATSVYYDEQVLVTNSTISNCSATSNGGAISSSGGTVVIFNSTISNCSVTGNYGMGGAIGSNGAGTFNITSSTISGCTALGSGSHGGAIYGYSGTVRNSRLLDNKDPLGKAIVAYSSSGLVNATENWWGTNSNPAALVTGPVTYNPWLVLGISAVPTSPGTTVVVANLTYDSDGIRHDPALGCIQDGLPVSFTILSGPGSLSSSSAKTSSGKATTIFTLATPPGTSVINAAVDNQNVSLTTTITGSALTPTVTGITPTIGSEIGGTCVTITGTGFTDKSTVRFGTVNAVSVIYVSAVHLMAIAPAGNGTVDITVTTAGGTSAKGPEDRFTYLAPPVAGFTAIPSYGEVPLYVTFMDTSTGSPTSWYWSFGDGSSSTLQNPDNIYYSSGNYTVSLTVFNAVGTNTTTKTDYIRGVPLAGDYRLYLYPGWNFISVPKTLSNGNDTARIFKDVDCASHTIWLYNASGQQWVAANTTTKINVLNGIWIYSATTATVPLYFKNEALTTPPTKMCYPGWNAIGFSDINAASARDTLSTISDKSWIAIGFDANQQQYDSSIISGSTNPLHMDAMLMYPQKGYWLYMTSVGDLAGISA